MRLFYHKLRTNPQHKLFETRERRRKRVAHQKARMGLNPVEKEKQLYFQPALKNNPFPHVMLGSLKDLKFPKIKRGVFSPGVKAVFTGVRGRTYNVLPWGQFVKVEAK
jgi:hypothetical protein